MPDFNLPQVANSINSQFTFIGNFDTLGGTTTCHIVPFAGDQIKVGLNSGTDLFTPSPGQSSITLVNDGTDSWIAIALTGTWNLSGTVIVGP